MTEIAIKKEIEEILIFEADIEDFIYNEIIYDEIYEYLSNYSEGTYFRYGLYNINSKPISKAIYDIFKMLEEYLYDIYFYRINFNLIMKSITVFYVFFNLTLLFTHKGRGNSVIDFLTDDEIIDVYLDALNYSGLDELIEDILETESIELEASIKEILIQLLQENINILRNDTKDIIAINKGFFALLNTLVIKTNDLFILLVKSNIQFKNKHINKSKLTEIYNTSPHELKKYGKKYLVDVINLKVLLVIPDERIENVKKDVIFELQ